MSPGIRIFIFSLLAAWSFKLVQISAGIENGFHPDSLYYVEHFPEYTAQGLLSFSVFNNLYYFIVGWMDADETALIVINQIAFALTNVFIARTFQYDFRYDRFIKIFVLFLPYRLHLSAHVLKDSLIILAVLGIIFSSIRNVGPMLLFTSAMRNVAGPAALLVRFFPSGSLFLLGFLALFMTSVVVSPTLFELLAERGDVDMIGRDYFAVPLSNTSSLAGIFAKILLWPSLARTGGFAAFALNPFVFLLALEPFVFLVWAIKSGRFIDYMTSKGLMVAMLFATLVTNYGAYHRYIYAFVIFDYVYTVIARSGAPKAVRKARVKPG